MDAIVIHTALLERHANDRRQVEGVLIVEDPSGRPTGAMGSFLSNPGDQRPLPPDRFETVSASLDGSPEAAKAFWRRCVAVFGLFGKSPELFNPADDVLEYIAIREDMRGGGLCGKLVQSHNARARGRKAFSTTATFGNSPVLRDARDPDHTTMGPERFNGLFPGFLRMVFDIGAGRPRISGS